jgi:DNA-directed RNA polymerase subunit RPC12/RpoP
MGRTCAACDYYLTCSSFSRNQWMKGDGYSRCFDCVDVSLAPPAPSYQCTTCNRVFNCQNELNMHQQVHRPRDMACPICGDRRFRSGANAVQHVETGSCSGCPGQGNARQQIYNFASKQARMHRYMTEAPMLTYDGYETNRAVPDFPYECRDCSKAFRNLSQLLQHQDQKHGNTSYALGYN